MYNCDPFCNSGMPKLKKKLSEGVAERRMCSCVCWDWAWVTVLYFRRVVSPSPCRTCWEMQYITTRAPLTQTPFVLGTFWLQNSRSSCITVRSLGAVETDSVCYISGLRILPPEISDPHTMQLEPTSQFLKPSHLLGETHGPARHCLPIDLNTNSN